MSESILKKLLKQVSMYFSSSVIITLAGFISFPIWTRVFTPAEYGKMSIAVATLGFIIVLSKMGINSAALRFYSEFAEHKRNLAFTYYYTTSFLSILINSLFTAVIFLMVIEFYPALQLDAQYKNIFRILPLMIIFESLIDIFLLFLRAEQKVKYHSLTRIAFRYSNLLINLLFVLVFKLGLTGYFISCAIIDGVFALVLGIKFFRQGKIRFNHFSVPLLKESISYGLPLIGLELSALLLTTGDRFLLQHFLGSGAVGLYSVSSNLVNYVVDFFADALKLAVLPILMAIWERNGKEESQQFLSLVSKIYIIVSVPIIFAVSFYGHDFIVLIASEKFAAGAVILPFIVAGHTIHKANFLFGAGLYLMKKTKALSAIIFGSALLNIILNIIFIPLLGLIGAAMTTLITFIIETILLIVVSFKTVNFKFDVHALLKYAAISMVMVGVMFTIRGSAPYQTFAKIIVGFFTYSVSLILFENEIRAKAALVFARIFNK